MKKIYMEFRSGIGGEEAELFMIDLLKVYVKFFNKNRLYYNLVSDNKTKILSVEGKEEFLKILLKENGIHKVQRISKNKMHTSTVSITCLPVVEQSTFRINPKDLEYSYFRSSGNGGQHRNTTDSAVRLVHKPTNTTVVCVSERSQFKNKEIALELLSSKLNNKVNDNIHNKVNNKRKEVAQDTERSNARRIYNYPRNEVIDNYSNKVCKLKDFLKGNIEVL